MGTRRDTVGSACFPPFGLGASACAKFVSRQLLKASCLKGGGIRPGNENKRLLLPGPSVRRFPRDRYDDPHETGPHAKHQKTEREHLQVLALM